MSSWSVESFLEGKLHVSPLVARNLVELFKNGNSLVFIARYRQEHTGGMDIDQLRRAEAYFNQSKNAKAKAVEVIDELDKIGVTDQRLVNAIRVAKSSDEVENLYSPYAPESQDAKVERLKEYGLEEAAMRILNGQYVDIAALVVKGAHYSSKAEPQTNASRLPRSHDVPILRHDPLPRPTMLRRDPTMDSENVSPSPRSHNVQPTNNNFWTRMGNALRQFFGCIMCRRGYTDGQPTGHRNRQSAGYVSPQPTGYMDRQPTGYMDRQPTGYMDRQPTGYMDRQPTGYMDRQPTGYMDRQPTGYMDRQPTGYMDRQPTGYMDRQPTGYMDRQPTGYVKHQNTGLGTVADVENGLVLIISDCMVKNSDTQQFINESICKWRPQINLKSLLAQGSQDQLDDQAKYMTYADFSGKIADLKPHQILAINRGEEQKFLCVTLELPTALFAHFQNFAWRSYFDKIIRSRYTGLVNKCIEHCFPKISEKLCKVVRVNLKKRADIAAVQNFASNVRQLLLQSPYKSTVICGIDPGFTHGCKCAVISQSSSVLATTVFYLPRQDEAMNLNRIDGLRTVLLQHRCSKIALGNGTGCRETERLLTTAIKNNFFQPLNVQYSIVNECGASIYSVTDVAKDELPNMEPNLRSAVSIARRLQDPLAELVKIEPKHLGVGMYQHDIQEKLLCAALDSVIEECVSFVGVDLNTCSQQLLQRTAGMNASRAAAVMRYRSRFGRIDSRQTFATIDGIDKLCFEQAAGFLRVFATVEGQRSSNGWNPLDATSVHPESYNHAIRILKVTNLTAIDVGTERCKWGLSKLNKETLVGSLHVSKEALKQIIEALIIPIQHDLREENSKPLFREGVMSLEEVRRGMVLSGQVNNVTHFGAFIDVGVGTNGLLHCKQFRNGPPVKVGQPIQVKVESVDLERKRIGLQFA